MVDVTPLGNPPRINRSRENTATAISLSLVIPTGEIPLETEDIKETLPRTADVNGTIPETATGVETLPRIVHVTLLEAGTERQALPRVGHVTLPGAGNGEQALLHIVREDLLGTVSGEKALPLTARVPTPENGVGRETLLGPTNGNTLGKEIDAKTPPGTATKTADATALESALATLPGTATTVHHVNYVLMSQNKRNPDRENSLLNPERNDMTRNRTQT